MASKDLCRRSKRGAVGEYSEDDLLSVKIPRFDDLGEEDNKMMSLSPSMASGIGGRRDRISQDKPAELFRKDLISAMKLADTEQLQQDDYVLISDPWRQDWEKGVQVPVNPEETVQRVVNVSKLPENENLHGLYAFKFPKKYLHGTNDENYKQGVHELHETQKLAEQVCRYDLDDLDVSWLELYNRERGHFGKEALHEFTMERLIEEIESQCYNNMQTMIKTVEGLGIEYDENVTCDVCRSPEGEDGNEIVFCDGCDICVHQACYGIQKIPEGSWLCRTCVLGIQPICILCPKSGGAMKSTKSGTKWAHVSCALWIPEVSIGCPEKMEPVTKISQIPSSRWSLICNICRDRAGACIQCSVKTCKTAFHVTCAFNSNFNMKTILDEAHDDVQLRAFCGKHSHNRKGSDSSPRKEPTTPTKRDKILMPEPGTPMKKESEMTEEEKTELRSHRLSKLAEEFYSCVETSEVAEAMKMDEETVDYFVSYWILKRKANFNKPLLMPKTEEADILSKQREDSLIARMKMFIHLRQDLERVRNLCYMVSRREKIRRSLYNMKESIFHQQIKLTEKVDRSTCFQTRDWSLISCAHKEPLTIYDQYDDILHKADLVDAAAEREEREASQEPKPSTSGEQKRDGKRRLAARAKRALIASKASKPNDSSSDEEIDVIKLASVKELVKKGISQTLQSGIPVPTVSPGIKSSRSKQEGSKVLDPRHKLMNSEKRRRGRPKKLKPLSLLSWDSSTRDEEFHASVDSEMLVREEHHHNKEHPKSKEQSKLKEPSKLNESSLIKGREESKELTPIKGGDQGESIEEEHKDIKNKERRESKEKREHKEIIERRESSIRILAKELDKMSEGESDQSKLGSPSPGSKLSRKSPTTTPQKTPTSRSLMGMSPLKTPISPDVGDDDSLLARASRRLSMQKEATPKKTKDFGSMLSQPDDLYRSMRTKESQKKDTTHSKPPSSSKDSKKDAENESEDEHVAPPKLRARRQVIDSDSNSTSNSDILVKEKERVSMVSPNSMSPRRNRHTDVHAHSGDAKSNDHHSKRERACKTRGERNSSESDHSTRHSVSKEKLSDSSKEKLSDSKDKHSAEDEATRKSCVSSKNEKSSATKDRVKQTDQERGSVKKEPVFGLDSSKEPVDVMADNVPKRISSSREPSVSRTEKDKSGNNGDTNSEKSSGGAKGWRSPRHNHSSESNPVKTEHLVSHIKSVSKRKPDPEVTGDDIVNVVDVDDVEDIPAMKQSDDIKSEAVSKKEKKSSKRHFNEKSSSPKRRRNSDSKNVPSVEVSVDDTTGKISLRLRNNIVPKSDTDDSIDDNFDVSNVMKSERITHGRSLNNSLVDTESKSARRSSIRLQNLGINGLVSPSQLVVEQHIKDKVHSKLGPHRHHTRHSLQNGIIDSTQKKLEEIFNRRKSISSDKCEIISDRFKENQPDNGTIVSRFHPLHVEVGQTDNKLNTPSPISQVMSADHVSSSGRSTPETRNRRRRTSVDIQPLNGPREEDTASILSSRGSSPDRENLNYQLRRNRTTSLTTSSVERTLSRKMPSRAPSVLSESENEVNLIEIPDSDSDYAPSENSATSSGGTQHRRTRSHSKVSLNDEASRDSYSSGRSNSKLARSSWSKISSIQS